MESEVNMIIEAICENGVVRMPSELRLQHNIFKVKVEIPDQEVTATGGIAETTKTGAAQSVPATVDTRNPDVGNRLLDRFEQILGPHREQLDKGRPFTEQDYKRLQQEYLEEKYLGRAKTSDS